MKSLLLPMLLLANASAFANDDQQRLFDPNPMGPANRFEKREPGPAPTGTADAPNDEAAGSTVNENGYAVPNDSAENAEAGTTSSVPANDSVANPPAASQTGSPPGPAAAGTTPALPALPTEGPVAPEMSQALPQGPITLYAAGNYRLRKWRWGPIQLIIPRGKAFEVLGRYKDFYQIRYDGRIGYVHNTGLDHPLAEAIQAQEGLKDLKHYEAAEIAACLTQANDSSTIPADMKDFFQRVQASLKPYQDAPGENATLAPATPVKPAPKPAKPAKGAPGAPGAVIPSLQASLGSSAKPAPGAAATGVQGPPASSQVTAPVSMGEPPPAAEPPPRKGSAGFISPVKNRACTTGGRRFGCYVHPILKRPRFHSGLDLAAPSGTPLVAPADCTLIDQRGQKTGGYGLQVRLQCGSRVVSYAHMARFAPAKKHYAQGEVVGYIGSTGLSTGPHLHLEVLEDGHRVDPTRVFGLDTFCPRMKPENPRTTGCGRAVNPIRRKK